MSTEQAELSVVVPVHNEELNVRHLHPRIERACRALGWRFEIVFVDDGSTDGTWGELQALPPGAGELVLVRLRRNVGQTPALAAGFESARGAVVVTMDGDLQNDPDDIPALVAQCESGYDLVCGWRKDRQDQLWSRKIPSRCANWLIRKVTGVHVHDYGCGLKAYRRDLVSGLRLYSDMHRFLPFVSQRLGARVGEMVVRHHPRTFGKTKYGLGRTWKVLLDLVSLKMLVHYYRRTYQWFLLMALPLVLLGLAALLMGLLAPGSKPMIVFASGILLVSAGVCVGLMGFLSNLLLGEDWKQLETLLVGDAPTGSGP